MAKTGKAYSKQSVKKTGRERKEKMVAELVEKLDSSNGLVFTEYKGITHQQLETLRKELKAADASILIAKNSLMKISLGKSKNFADFKNNENLAGSAATLFIGKDSIEPLKKLQKSIKDTGLPTIKFGVLEGQLLDEAGVIKLASLPTREVLLAQFVGMLNSPIQGFVSGLNAIPQKFVMTLDAIAKNKPADSASAPEPTTTPATESPAETNEKTSNETPAETKNEVAAKSEDEVSTEVQGNDSAEAKTDDLSSEEVNPEESSNDASETEITTSEEENTETNDKGGEDK